ncbi:isopentenyldiphosphate isomerase [Paenibacillus sp. W4I10]|nr:isopentenyldiphosphate isomerase [Paenibacillus sp. W4I10]
MGYIMELRKLVGSRPLIMAGSCVLVFNEEGHLLLQKRTDSLDWGDTWWINGTRGVFGGSSCAGIV